MRIGELAQRTGVSTRSLRYYEQQGLLAAQRSTAGQRMYNDDAADRVALLRRLYGAGLSSATIATLLPCVDAPSATSTRATVDLMRRELDRLDRQVAELTTTRDQLAFLIDAAQVCGHEQATAELAPAGT